MNCFRLLLACLFALPLTAQSSTITVNATGCRAVYLYQFNGSGFDTEADLSKTEDGSFTLELTYDEPKFRYVGAKPSDALPVMISPGESFEITGDCGRMRNGQVTGSALNDGYQQLKKTFQSHNGRFSKSTRAYQTASRQGDSTAIQRSLKELKQLDREKTDLLADLKINQPLLGRIASLNTYQSFLTSNDGRFASELDYFVNTYFQYVDFEDDGYNDLPWTYEGNRNFTNTLTAAVKGEELADILLKIYDQWPAGSRAQLFAMSGGFSALVAKKHPAAVKLSKSIIERYEADYPAAVKQIKQQSAGLKSFSVGEEAPTFAGETPDGELIKLESLRGKVVLIDFWASWCGPCRRENPNVVKVYERYKDKGFEILAVSLDSNKDRWLKAIADDKLTWLHVSELKGWKGDISRTYGVNSIPQTVLLDAEGRILARNLRGPALERKIAEVLSGK